MAPESAVAVVLAAGRGERMQSDRAKVLHELLGRPLLHHVLRSVRGADIARLLVVTHHQADAVRKAAGDGLTFVAQGEPKGTGHAAGRCREALTDHAGDLLVVCGDAPLLSSRTIKRLTGLHRSKNADATVLTACLDNPGGYGRVIRDSQGRITKIVEEAEASEPEKIVQEINSGTIVFRASSLWKALDGLAPRKNGEVYLTDTIARILAAGGTVETLVAENAFEAYGINTRSDLVAATNWLRWQVLQSHMAAGVTVVDPSTTFIESDVEIGRDTVIQPFTVIRHDVRVGRDCVIGPFSHLRSGTVIGDEVEIGNFVEVNRSRVGRGTKAKHLTYLGDATVGDGCNIGAGTITANYDAGRKNPTVLEDGAFTGCNTVLVAPVRMGRNSKTGAGTVVPKGRDVPEGSVVVGVPARPLKKASVGGKRA